MARPEYNAASYKRALKELKGQPCVYCSQPSDSVDHVVPLSMGGANDRSNMVACCRRCNYKRGGRLGRRMMGRKKESGWRRY